MTISNIIAKTYKRTHTNSNTYDATDLLIDINNAYEYVVSLILNCDGRWQYDDSNNTDIPVATTTVTSGTNKYTLDLDHLKILDVEIKDSNGRWSKLLPIDQKDISENLSISTEQAVTGVPVYYDKVGENLFLYPTPDYTQAASLKIYYQRGPYLFTSADVTAGVATPGFASLFHHIIPLKVSSEYAVDNNLKSAQGLLIELERAERELKEFYSKRDKDERVKVTIKSINHR